MKKILQNAYTEARKMPKVLWLAAVVVPGGFVGVSAYLAGKSVYNHIKKKDKDGN